MSDRLQSNSAQNVNASNRDDFPLPFGPASTTNRGRSGRAMWRSVKRRNARTRTSATCNVSPGLGPVARWTLPPWRRPHKGSTQLWIMDDGESERRHEVVSGASSNGRPSKLRDLHRLIGDLARNDVLGRDRDPACRIRRRTQLLCSRDHVLEPAFEAT